MRGRLLLLEIAADEGGERFQSALGVFSVGADFENRAVTGGQHHEAHDTLAIDAFIVLLDDDIAGKTAGSLDELGGGPGVNAQLVPDRELTLDNIGL